jgi:hypothetical protein
MIAVKEPEFDARLLTGIQLALRKARELGYPVERMDVTASVTQGICSVHFARLPQPGTIATGGDLSVNVDALRQEVVGFKRGQ